MRHRSHALRRHYARENPLSEGEMIGLAVGGVALLGGVGYLLYRSMHTTVAFTAADFANLASEGISGPVPSANGTIAYMDLASDQSALVGTLQSYNASTTTGSFVVTGAVSGNVGQMTPATVPVKYPVGTTITGVPGSYIITQAQITQANNAMNTSTDPSQSGTTS